MMNDSLIELLCQRLEYTHSKRTRISRHVLVPAVILAALTVLIMAKAFWFDWEGRIASTFGFATVTQLFVASIAAWVVFLSSVPGRIQNIVWFALLATLGILASWATALYPNFETWHILSPFDMQHGGTCLLISLGLTALSSCLLGLSIRRNFCTQPQFTGAVLLYASGMISSFLLQLICVSGEALHAPLYHTFPTLAYLLLGVFLVGPLLIHRWQSMKFSP